MDDKIVLVTGGRTYSKKDMLYPILENLQPTLIIEGGALGADKLARTWAYNNGVHCATVPALWTFFGAAAGPFRNRAMLLLRPDVCVACPGGPGTANMVKQCRNKKIPIIFVDLPPNIPAANT